MTSFTWRSNRPQAILGCGVDIEKPERFERYASETDCPMPFAFTTTEFELARSRGPLFAERLCIAYSAKEALFKALGAPYDFTECEVPAVDIASSSRDQGNRLQLGEGLRDAFGVSDAVLFAQRHPSSEEIIATVIAYREDDH